MVIPWCSAEYKRSKDVVLNRDNYSCYRCGKQYSKHDNLNGKLMVHHIDKNPSNNDIANMIPLCRRCHAVIHKI